MLPGAPGRRGRLVNKMVNLRQDRGHDEAPAHISRPASEGAAANGRAAAPRSTVLSVRLGVADRSGSPAAVSWTADSPAAALAIDVIAASDGAPDPPRGAVLQSCFFNLQSALLAARRLQWALEGLTESSGAATAAAISIHAVEDPVAGSVGQMLEDLMPGQVLVSAGIAESVHQLPGVTLRPARDSHWRELQWPSQAGPSTLEADELSVLSLIRALGRQDPCPPRVEEPVPVVAAPVPATSGAHEAPASFDRILDETEPAQMPFWKKPWALVSAGAAVLVLLAAVIIPTMVSGGHSKKPDPVIETAPAKAPPSPPPASLPRVTGAPAAPETSQPQTPATKPGKQLKAAVNPGAGSEAPAIKPTPASCDLTAGEIPRSLSRAESLMYAGKLAEAQDAYQHLVGCPSAREKAVEGLRLVKQRMATQGP